MLQVKLTPVSGDAPIEVDGPVFSIGREKGCDHQIINMQVSRHHCDLYVEDSAVKIRDRGSRNGTFVNGEMVLGDHELHDEDTLAIAPLLYKVSIRSVEDSDGPRFLHRLRDGVRRLASP